MRRMVLLFLSIFLLFASCLPLSPAFSEGAAGLQKGDSGPEVDALKERMYVLGYFTSRKFSPIYNDITAQRVALLQEMNGLEPTGTCSPELLSLIFSDDVITADGKRYADRDLPSSPSEVPLSDAPASEAEAAPASPPPEPPERNEEGFLTDSSLEYVYRDSTGGLWLYFSSTLQVEIHRYTDPSVPLVWYETEVKAVPGENLKTVSIGNIEKGRLLRPQTLARQEGAVLAFSDDYFFYRVRNHLRTGVIIRSGEILCNGRNGSRNFPGLETLACFPDGSMQCFKGGEHTGEEYLAMGALDVFSFGPILVSGGEAGEKALREDYYHYREPRCALGMIEPGHYLILTVNGRSDASKGCYFSFLVERMLSWHVQEALNLDGGGTTALCFMGEQINADGASARSVASLITFGTSRNAQTQP